MSERIPLEISYFYTLEEGVGTISILVSGRHMFLLREGTVRESFREAELTHRMKIEIAIELSHDERSTSSDSSVPGFAKITEEALAIARQTVTEKHIKEVFFCTDNPDGAKHYIHVQLGSNSFLLLFAGKLKSTLLLQLFSQEQLEDLFALAVAKRASGADRNPESSRKLLLELMTALESLPKANE